MLLRHSKMLIVMRYFLASNKVLLLNLLLFSIQSPLVTFQGLRDAEVPIFLTDGIRNRYLAPLMLQKSFGKLIPYPFVFLIYDHKKP